MKHEALTLMILTLNHLLDTRRYDSVTVDEVKEHIADGSILRFLRDRAGEDIDLSVHKDGGPYGNFERFYVSYLQAIQDAYGGQGRRKWGVENRGLCLLVAWTAQILQDGADWRPNLNTAGVEPA